MAGKLSSSRMGDLGDPSSQLGDLQDLTLCSWAGLSLARFHFEAKYLFMGEEIGWGSLPNVEL